MANILANGDVLQGRNMSGSCMCTTLNRIIVSQYGLHPYVPEIFTSSALTSKCVVLRVGGKGAYIIEGVQTPGGKEGGASFHLGTLLANTMALPLGLPRARLQMLW